MRKGALFVATLLLVACGAAPEVALQPSATPPTPSPAPSPTATASPTRTATSTPAPTATATATTTPTPTEPAQETTTATAAGSEADAMLLALNLRRNEAGCSPLVIDERLQQAAQGHADDLFARQAIDHVGGDGATLEQRLERVGYPFVRRSEVIARAHGTDALTVVDQWLAEPPDGPHRTSVLGCDYADTGIGWRETEDAVAYWVVDFGEPRGD